jgi:hypothetical protein
MLELVKSTEHSLTHWQRPQPVSQLIHEPGEVGGNSAFPAILPPGRDAKGGFTVFRSLGSYPIIHTDVIGEVEGLGLCFQGRVGLVPEFRKNRRESRFLNDFMIAACAGVT